jgi:predicted N-acetyltransferase YhbS
MAGIFQKLDGGLVLRSATPEDADAVVAFHARIQSDVEEWTRVLIDGSHPTTGPGDFTLVEDDGKIVSSMCMIPQTWTYGGIYFGLSRMEMVSTDAQYRWRGLARAQFKALERDSAARGHRVQVVVGRPYVYRRLGYHMALPYAQGVEVARQGISPLKEGESEPFAVRDAVLEDLPLWQELFDLDNRRSLVACRREVRDWRHDFFERGVSDRIQLRMIEDRREGAQAAGQVVGGLVHSPGAGDGLVYVYALVLRAGISWLDAAPSVMRYLERTGDAYAAKEGARLNGFWFGGPDHPILAALTDSMRRVAPESPLAWYVRLPDLAGFLMHIAPVINNRLPGSVADGWSGSLNISFYESETKGITLKLEKGRLVKAENSARIWHEDSAMPAESFNRLLFGYRSVDEIEAETAEVYLNNTSRAVLRAMFPKLSSRIFSIA